MTRRVPSPAWLVLALVAALAGGCTTPADRLSEAMELADDGKFDEALVVLDEVQRLWPDRPEATAARDAVEGIHERAALARYGAGDYAGVATLLERLPGPARARLFEKQPAMRWVPKLFGPAPDDETLLAVLAAAEAPEPMKTTAGAKLCERAATHAPVCRGEGRDPAGLDIAAAIGTLERVDHACRILEGLRGRCQGEAGTQVAAALDARFGQRLRARIAELERSYERGRLAGDE